MSFYDKQMRYEVEKNDRENRIMDLRDVELIEIWTENFGMTLLDYLADNHPETYRSMIQTMRSEIINSNIGV